MSYTFEYFHIGKFKDLHVASLYVSKPTVIHMKLGVLSLEAKNVLKPRKKRYFDERLAAFNVSEPNCLKYIGIDSLDPEGV